MRKSDILIVDDQPSVCKEISSFLGSEFNVHAFKNGQEALDYMELNGADLVLLDYDMPGLTGFEVLMAIRQHKSTHDTPVVFLTGETNERMRLEMMGRGATDYLCKPVSSSELHHCVRKHLRPITD